MSSGRRAVAALGLPPDATRHDIARAYRRLALLTHPDVSREPLAAQRFASLTDTYQRALAESDTRPAAATTPRPASRPRRIDGRQFVAGPVHVVPQPFRPIRKEA